MKEMKEMKIYISGPMTGVEGLNKYAFKGAEELLKMQAHEVINPHNLPEPKGLTDDPKINWCLWMEQDLDVIRTKGINCLALLPGYEQSPGAILEKWYAEKLGIPSIEIGEFL